MTRTPKDRTEAGATSAGLGAPVPAPPGSLSVACAEGGQAETTPAARATPVAATSLGGREPSRTAIRGGSACPVVGTAGQASTSPPEPPTRGSRGARGKEGPLDLGLPAARPRPSSRDGRGTSASVGPEQGHGPASTSPPGTEGSPGGARKGEPALRRRTPGVGSPSDTSPAGDRRLNAASPAAPLPLSGDDFRKAWKAAESANAAAGRNRRGKRPNTAASPGVGRLRVAAPRPEAFDAPPPPSIRIRPPEPPPEAAL